MRDYQNTHVGEKRWGEIKLCKIVQNGSHKKQAAIGTALDVIRSGQLLTASQVAQEYGLTKRAVTMAASEGKLTEQEAILTPLGWLISRAAAERLWGRRRGRKVAVGE